MGDVDVETAGGRALGGPNQRRILAALAIRRGEIASLPWLVDVVWPGGSAPARAEHNIRTYVHRLRFALGPDASRIATAGTGYRMHVETGELDIARFERACQLAAEAFALHDLADAADHVCAAASEWRGRPLEGFEHEPWAEPTVTRLLQRWADLRELRAAVLVDSGRAADAIADLEELIGDEPYRERPRILLMRALYESGRPTEALRAFQAFRQTLMDDVGVEPSRELVELDRAIAVGAVTLDGEPAHRVGAYVLHERVGSGAFAVVHRATQPSLGREVAIKIIRAEFANEPSFIRSFETEAQTIARVEHPNIVPLYDYWREPDRACLAMRWMPGGSLAQLLDGAAPAWSVQDVLAVIDDVGAALDAAHARGVSHGDVKPSNILFDAEGRAHLSDFGIAREASAAGLGLDAGIVRDVASLADIARVLLGHVDAPRRAIEGALDSARGGGRSASAMVVDLRRAVESADSASRSGLPPPNPYKGLDAFRESDAADLHGRDGVVDEIVSRLARGARLCTVTGASGAGKSSVVRAGLIPVLRGGAVPGSERWFVTTMVPGATPYEALDSALRRVARDVPSDLLAVLRSDHAGIAGGFRRAMSDGDTVLLVIDQFEELFTAGSETGDRNRFLDALASAITDPDVALRVVASIRSDCLDGSLLHPAFGPLTAEHVVTVGPIKPEALERAITLPAARVGVSVEAGLVSELVADVSRHPNALPLLQYSLRLAFEHGDRRTVRLADHHAIGGMAGALALRAEQLWSAATDRERAAMRTLFRRLVNPGGDAPDTRRRVPRSELVDDPALTAVIECFGTARLLAFDHEPLTREPTIEIAHDAVLVEWPRLRQWCEDDREELRLHRQLTASAAGWVARGRDAGELYRGPRLAAVEPLATMPGLLNPVEAEFLAAGLALRSSAEGDARRRARRRWYVTVALGVVAALAASASIVAVHQRGVADRQRDRADRSAEQARANEAVAGARAIEAEAARDAAADALDAAEDGRTRAEQATAAGDLERLEGQALRFAATDPDLAALLAVEAYRLSDGAISSADVLQRILSSTDGVESRISGVYGRALLSADGRRMVAFGLSRVDVWDLLDRAAVHQVELRPGNVLLALAASTDLARVAFSDLDGTHVLDTATGELATIASAPAPALAFASDGRELAVAAGAVVQFWTVAPGPPTMTEMLTVGGVVQHIAWNPVDDGFAVVADSPSAPQAVEYWDRNDLSRSWRYEPEMGTNGRLGLAASIYTSDGSELVVANGEQQGSGAVVRRYDTRTGAVLGPQTYTPASFNDMAWTDEAARVIAGTVVPTGMQAVDVDAGANTSPPFRAIDASAFGFSKALGRYVTAGLGGIEIRRPGSGPLERVIEFTPEQQDSMRSGGQPYAVITRTGTEVISGVFNVARPTPAAVFGLASDPPRVRYLDGPLLPTSKGGHVLFASQAGEFELVDDDLRPVGEPVPVQGCTRWWSPSADGRYFAIYCERFAPPWSSVYLYRASGELVRELRIPNASPPWQGIVFSFSADGTRLYGHLNLGGLQWAVWDTESGELIDAGEPDELQRPIVVDDRMYVQRGVDDFALLQLDPMTYEPIGPVIEAPLYIVSNLAGNGTGTLLAVYGFDGVTRVFDTSTGRQLGREIPGNRNVIASFAGDGTSLLVQSDDHLSLWNYDRATWPQIACTLAGRNLTAEEWEAWGPRTIERHATCAGYSLDSSTSGSGAAGDGKPVSTS